MTEFQVGELVDIHIKGARVASIEQGFAEIAVGTHRTVVDLTHPQVTVNRLGPAGWPPQAGDVWKDSNDEEWFAATRTATSPVELFLADFSSSMAMEPDDLAAKFGPLRLVRRREPAEPGSVA